MKIFVIADMSANGMIAEKEQQVSLDWTSEEDRMFFIKKTKEASVMVMGRKTFETIGKPLKGRLIKVMTRDVAGRENIEGQIEWTDADPATIIAELKERGYDQVAIAGGAEVYRLFVESGLVTDLYLTIEAVLFGNGTPFLRGFDRIDMNLQEVRQLGEQTVLLHYSMV
jgi:dihydrofolate reductase